MPATVQQLVAKANGTIKALDTMSSKEREKIPTIPFAEDFNKFRAMALEAKAEIKDVAPAPIEMINQPGYHAPRATYAEVLAYWRQMLELL